MTLDRVPGLEDVEAGDGVDEKTLYDPHTWLDPEKAGEEAQIIADKLSEVDSEHKETYQKKCASLLSKKLKNWLRNSSLNLKKRVRKHFVTQHTAFSYLAKRISDSINLEFAGISPEQEPSPRQLTEIQEFCKNL